MQCANNQPAMEKKDEEKQAKEQGVQEVQEAEFAGRRSGW